MAKIIRLVISIVLLFSIFTSCEEEDILLENDLARIEKIVRSYKSHEYEFFDPYEEIHFDFLSKLSNMQTISDEDEFQSALELLLLQNSRLVLKSGIEANNDGEEWTKEEEQILKSYVQALSSGAEADASIIAELYIAEITQIEYIEEQSKNKIIYGIGFHRSLIKFLDAELELDIDNLKSGASRSCFNSCVNEKTKQMDDWNWVDWAWFLAKPHMDVARWASSCMWDCHFA